MRIYKYTNIHVSCQYSIIRGKLMIKKRSDSRKKKNSQLPLHNTSKRYYVPQNISDKYFKKQINITNYKLHPYTSIKSATSTPHNISLVKPQKSSNATPNIKSRKSSKQNINSHNLSYLYSYTESRKHHQNMQTSEVEDDEQIQYIKKKADFRFIYTIGSGGFGRVWKVQDKKQHKAYAMKQMSKAKIINKKSVVSIINQKQLLEQINSPFIINSCHNFQDRQNLYLVMEYLRGGDLRYHMCFYEYYDEQQTKFIAVCIILALEYIHSKDIVHRDLKPENIVFQENGYARLTDFGVARKRKQNNSEQTSGTPGYMSPEVICRMNHSFQSDYFALGVIIYELMFGTRPYMGDSRKQIRQKILAYQAKIHDRDLPIGWNPTSIDFVNKLLKRNKEHRLGYNGIQQLKNHPWLKNVNWVKMYKKQIRPPFVPGVICQSPEYQRQMQTSLESQTNQDTMMLLRTPEVQKLFKKYESNKKQKKKHPQILAANSNFRKFN